MQKHFSYDELTPLEQCIASIMAGRGWSREQLPTYNDDAAPQKKPKRLHS